MLTQMAMVLALASAATQLTIAPWSGADLQATNTQAAKYRLEVKGKPNATIRLEATGVAGGWLAAFCTSRVCSPQHIDAQLPSSGVTVLQFELIRESGTAPKESGATIRGDDGAAVRVPAAFRQ